MKLQLTNDERNLILKISSHLEKNKSSQLRYDLHKSSVTFRANDGYRAGFEMSGYQRPIYKGQHSYGVEGKIIDMDGGLLSVVLYADENNRLLELEIIRWDGGDSINPNWNSLEIYS